MPSRLKSVTFIELLIAIILLAVVILAINDIDIFSRHHIISSDQRAKVQNDVSRCLEHITKNASNATGNETSYGANTTVYISPDSTNTTTLSFFTDTNGNGLRDTGGEDYWISYNLSNNTLIYCNQCPNAACAVCSGSEDVLAKDITAFSAAKDFTKGNYMNVSITGCWDPSKTCGTSTNPSVNMSTTLTLPSLSTN
ncbi:MAG: hypothetical protein PHO03_04795 [Candidatus Omnitrophica bacterium]|nr:hypothetical protein [Candidatus Omnitrophota bacterium]